MNIDGSAGFATMSEADLASILELLQGGDPDVAAQQSGMTRENLFKLRDELLAQVESERAQTTGVPSKKIGRNEPCPCGSGKKYKYCCLNSHKAAIPDDNVADESGHRRREAKQKRLIGHIEEIFALLRSGRYTELFKRASGLIKKYPNEDRLHDILATGHIYVKEFDAAIEICQRRLTIAESEKAFFVEKGRYRDADMDRPALSYYYPPSTWLQKYWIALKARDYQSLYPLKEDPAIIKLVRTLQTADDVDLFPQKRSHGLELRRNVLRDSLQKLKRVGPDVIPYLLPLTVKYSWAGLFVPEILWTCPVEASTGFLMDISMFGFAYASGACLHYLEKQGEVAIPYIEEAFSREKEFDPIKTGLISVLGNIRTPSAYGMLMGFLDHQNPVIVNWAGDALGKFDNIKALPAMEAANERIGGERMIENAIYHLKDIGN